MQDGVSEEIKKAVAFDRYHRDSCMRKLCLLALAATIFIKGTLSLKFSDQIFASPQFVGSVIGTFMGLFIIPTLFFAVVRLARTASIPTRGLGTGVVILLLLSVGFYQGSLKTLNEAHGGATVEDAGATRR